MSIKSITKTFSLDLGCGITPKNHYSADYVYGVDIGLSGFRISKVDLTVSPLPYPDNFFDYCTAHDFIEHIPRIIYIPERIQPFINLMSEIWRVLKIGGRFYSETPSIPSEPTFQDPTHVNYITSETYKYFAGSHLNLCRMYGFKGEFKLISQKRNGMYLNLELEKIFYSSPLKPSYPRLALSPPIFSKVINGSELETFSGVKKYSLSNLIPNLNSRFSEEIYKKSIVYRINNAFINGWGLVSLERKGVFYTLVDGKITAAHNHLHLACSHSSKHYTPLEAIGKGYILLDPEIRNSNEIPSATLIGKHSDSVYGHFIIEQLTSSFVTKELSLDNKKLCYDNNLDYQYKILRKYFRKSELEFITKGSLLKCETLYIVISSIGYSKNNFLSPLSLIAAKDLVDIFSRNNKKEFSENIFIVREPSPTNKRVLSNLGKLKIIAKRLKFKIIDPFNLDIEDQIYIYSNAKKIIVEQGSGSHNLIFTNSGIEVLLLKPADNENLGANKIDSSIIHQKNIKSNILKMEKIENKLVNNHINQYFILEEVFHDACNELVQGYS